MVAQSSYRWKMKWEMNEWETRNPVKLVNFRFSMMYRYSQTQVQTPNQRWNVKKTKISGCERLLFNRTQGYALGSQLFILSIYDIIYAIISKRIILNVEDTMSKIIEIMAQQIRHQQATRHFQYSAKQVSFPSIDVLLPWWVWQIQKVVNVLLWLH